MGTIFFDGRNAAGRVGSRKYDWSRIGVAYGRGYSWFHSRLNGNAFIGYATLFGFEMAILFTAFILSFRLNVESSLAREEERSIMLLEAAAD